MNIFFQSSFNLQKTLAEQNLEDTRQQLLAARSSQAKAIANLETQVLTSLPVIPVSGWYPGWMMWLWLRTPLGQRLPFKGILFWSSRHGSGETNLIRNHEVAGLIPGLT